MNVILIGPQGSGKGTQADRISQHLGLKKISTGDLFRAEIREQTDLGKTVKGFLDRGELVPDETTLAIVEESLERIEAEHLPGAVFDGFPRTSHQAEGLDRALAARGSKVDHVIELVIPEPVLIERLAGRRVCEDCGRVYQVDFHPPAVEGVCDVCGGKLVQRDDDKPEAIHRRLQLFSELTAPLLDYYSQRGIVSDVNADQPVEEVEKAIIAALGLTSKEGV